MVKAGTLLISSPRPDDAACVELQQRVTRRWWKFHPRFYPNCGPSYSSSQHATPDPYCYAIEAMEWVGPLLTPLSTRSRRAPRRLEGLGNGGLRAELRVLAHHHHLRHQRQRPQCRARHARPPVRRQHQRLHVCWPSLYVCQHRRSLPHRMAFGPTELDNKE